MLSRETEFYLITLGPPAIIITLFVLYLYFKHRNRRL